MKSSRLLSYTLAGSLLLGSPAIFAKLYKWVDEHGNTHYSTTLPPEASQKAHSQLNQSGRTVDSVGRAPTPEEREKMAELERLRIQQEKLIEKQQADDAVLLKTYRNESDLVLARDLKLNSLDNLINITRGNIKRFKVKLTTAQADAARQEKSGKTVDRKIVEDIESLQRQIENGYDSIADREIAKEGIYLEYDRDIKRFRTLKNMNTGEAMPKYKDQVLPLKTVYYCEDKMDCDQAWEKAVGFVKQHATTPLQLVGSNLFMTASPNKPDDVTLSISRLKLPNSDKEKIFLDQQCHQTTEGSQFCAGETSQQIKQQFLPTLLGK